MIYKQIETISYFSRHNWLIYTNYIFNQSFKTALVSQLLER